VISRTYQTIRAWLSAILRGRDVTQWRDVKAGHFRREDNAMKHRCESYQRESYQCGACGSASKRRAFTLIELLIVLAIIGLLAAILFPAFRRAKESGYQANCAANLQQIYQAVQLYRQDEKYYPSSLASLLPADYELADYEASATFTNTDGAGYFKGGRDGLVCKDDDTESTLPRSSYGDISTKILDAASAPVGPTNDFGRYIWNYYGYRDGNTGCTDADVRTCAGTAYLTASDASAAAATLRLDSSSGYNPRSNPIKYSLSNRYAPTSTIITHCVYHRMPTASGKISGPYDVYTDANGAMARDLILRLDGTAKPLDISAFATNNNWQKQNF
jgi:prepilin-type N-terminal cleavage/methylation domain-containing protein